MQSIGWELVASTNHIDNCLAGSESEYDFQGDGWEVRGLVSTLKFGS